MIISLGSAAYGGTGMLEMLGLDQTCESVYRAMLANDSWGVAQLADHLMLPESDVHVALDQLAELALLHRSFDGDLDMLRPVSPEVALGALIARQEADVARRQQQLAESRASMAQLAAEYSRQRFDGRGGEAENLRSVDAVHRRLEQLAHEATSSCLSFMPGGAQSMGSMAASEPLDRHLLDRGLTVRTVYLDSMRNDPATVRYARWLTELGGEVRTIPTLPIRMVLFDQTAGLLPIDPDNTRLGAVQVAGAGVMLALVRLFEAVWVQAVPFGMPLPVRPDDALTGQQRELLRLLAAGLTDESAGRRLGLSLRSVRRMMADLMNRLDAHSRFEAGVRAARCGWL
jgi:DNA-binding CsgD family transcriptional regulator